MIEMDRYVKILVRYNITEKQLFALLLAYSQRKDLQELYKKSTGTKVLLEREDKEVLRKKGFLEIDRSREYVLTDAFLEMFVDKDIATAEVYDIYPTYMLLCGKKVPLTNMDRSIFANLYSRSIDNFKEEHQEILKDIEYAKGKDLLNIKIEEFLKSKYWIKIRKIRQGEDR